MDIKGRYEAGMKDYEDRLNKYCDEAKEHISTSNNRWGDAEKVRNNIPGYMSQLKQMRHDIEEEIANERMTVAERKEAMENSAAAYNDAFKKMRGFYFKTVNTVTGLAKKKVEDGFSSKSILFSLSEAARDKIFCDAWEQAYEDEHSEWLYHVMDAYDDALSNIEKILGIAKKDWNK